MTSLEGQPAAIVEREIVVSGDLDETVVKARLLNRHFESHELARMAGQRHCVFDRGDSLQREPDFYVSSGKNSGVEDAGRDDHGLAVTEVCLFGDDVLDGQVGRQRAADIDQLDVRGRREVARKWRAKTAFLKVGQEKHLALRPS